jgi:hypothetical protein
LRLHDGSIVALVASRLTPIVGSPQGPKQRTSNLGAEKLRVIMWR